MTCSATCQTRASWVIGAPQGKVYACGSHLAMLARRATIPNGSVLITRLDSPQRRRD